LDDISGSGQTAAAHDLCSNISPKNRQHLEVPGAGHYGIFSGRRWREVVYPEVVKFILAHNGVATRKKSVATTVATTVAKTTATTAKRAVKAVAKKAPASKK
jgi:poly(3-hydroxybutyrate) depolymerase